MSAIDTIRSLSNQSARDLRDALLKYRRNHSGVPYSIEAAPRLYGDLLRHYLQWSAGLLGAMQDAGAARAAAQPDADHLIQRCASYFEAPARWPGISSLDHPARLLVPAYYAVRAAQHVNGLFLPPLVTLDPAEAHEFAIEILGHKASDTICSHKNADLSGLERRKEEQPPEKPLHYRSFLHAGNRDSLKAARAATPKPPAPPAPPPPGVTRSAVSRSHHLTPAKPVTAEASAQSWDRDLANTTIVLGRWNSPPDYSGSTYSSTESFLYLLGNHRFRKEVRGTTRLSYAGIASLTPIHKETRGTWEVRSTGTIIYLVLRDEAGDMESLRLERAPGGLLRVDGRDRVWRP